MPSRRTIRQQAQNQPAYQQRGVGPTSTGTGAQPTNTNVVANQYTSPDQVPGVYSPTYSDVGIFGYSSPATQPQSSDPYRLINGDAGISDGRAAAGAPLQYSSSGARGVAGSLGINQSGGSSSTNGGVIEQKRNERLDANNATPEQRATNQQNLQGIMDAGFGVSREDRAQAKRLEDFLARVNDPSLGTVGTDLAGNPIINKNLAEQQRQRMIAEYQTELYQNNLNFQAKTQEMQQNPIAVPSVEDFTAGFPEEVKDQAAAVYGPVFEAIEAQRGQLQQIEQNGASAIDAIGSMLAEYTQQRQQENQMIEVMQEQYNQKILQSQLDQAERTHQIERANAQIAYQRNNELLELQIRDQRITNEKNRKDQLLGLGISGGWRASRQTADVLDALAKGDRIISDLRRQQAYSGDAYAKDLNNALANYQNKIDTAYDGYRASAFALQKESLAAAREIDKTVFNSKTEEINARSRLKEKTIEAVGTFAAQYAKTVSDENRFLIEQAADARKMEIQTQQIAWDRAMEMIDVYGAKNIPPEQLRALEKSVGLIPGALSGPTLKEIKEMGSGSGGTGSIAGGPVAQEVDNRRAEYRQIYGDYITEEQIDFFVSNDLNEIYGARKEGDSFMQQVYNYQSLSPINGKEYRVYPFSTSSTIGRQLYDGFIGDINNKKKIEEIGPNAFYKRLVEGYQGSNASPSDTDKQRALEAMKKYGYTRLDRFGKPNFEE